MAHGHQQGIGFQGGNFGMGAFQQSGGGGGFGGAFGGIGSSLALSGGNPLLAAGLFAGGQLLGGLGGLIGGPSRSQKANRSLFGRFQGQLNAPPPDFLNINKVFGDLRLGLRPQIEAQAQGLSKSLGITSPLAKAGLAQSTISSFAQIRGQLQQQLAQLQLQDMLSLRRSAVQTAQFV